MLTFGRLTMRNFLSVGAAEQEIRLDAGNFTQIVGDNRDVPGENSSNGAGKTLIINALHYALYGSTISDIKRIGYAVNWINGKNMLVTLDFERGGVRYRIERGRKPDVLRLFADGAADEAESESRHTQARIAGLVGMGPELFKRLVAVSTETTPFLQMKAAEQSAFIEELLGITALREKADKLKELKKETDRRLTAEDGRLALLQAENDKALEVVGSLEARSAAWQAGREREIAELAADIGRRMETDLDAELAAHEALAAWEAGEAARRADAEHMERLAAERERLQAAGEAEQNALAARLGALLDIDIEAEIAAHEALAEWTARAAEIQQRQGELARARADKARAAGDAERLAAEIEPLANRVCHYCGQSTAGSPKLHDAALDAKLQELRGQLAAAEAKQAELAEQETALAAAIAAMGEAGERPVTIYPTAREAYDHQSKLDSLGESLEGAAARLQEQLAANAEQRQAYAARLAAMGEPGPRPVTLYPTAAQAHSEQAQLDAAEAKLRHLTEGAGAADPHAAEIARLRAGLRPADRTRRDELQSLLDHQTFLLDLLTGNRSFVRQRIIEQNLGLLNRRLAHYLAAIRLPFEVQFLNDLTVDIVKLGKGLDPGNLSRGQRNRLILGLSWAFRDVHESLKFPVNLMFIDEMLDFGTDGYGVETCLDVLEGFVADMGRTVYLVSHRREIMERVANIITVVLEDQFTRLDAAE